MIPHCLKYDISASKELENVTEFKDYLVNHFKNNEYVVGISSGFTDLIGDYKTLFGLIKFDCLADGVIDIMPKFYISKLKKQFSPTK